MQGLDATCKRYAEHAGLGWDRIHPRTILLAPLALKMGLLDLMHTWERNPCRLRNWLSKILFKSKPDGGQRPIASAFFVLRLWSRMRSPISRQWEREHDFPFFWGQKGRTCERAGWVHNVFAAWAAKRGVSVASFFLDLSKFYENISHLELYQEAIALDFNLAFLKCLCVFYSGYRTIDWEQCVAQPFTVRGTSLAGCSNATTIAKLLLCRALRRSTQGSPLARVTNIVDDVTAQVYGTTELVAVQGTRVVGSLLDSFRALRTPVNLQKTVFLASDAATAEAIRARLPDARQVATTRNVGSDATDGLRRHTPIAHRREEESAARARRLQAFKDSGTAVASIHRAGPAAVALWGSAITGLPGKRLHALRLQAARAFNAVPQGAAVGLRLRCFRKGASYDPAVLNIQQVGKAWAEAVQSGYPPLNILDDLLAEAKARATRHTQPWAHSVDPVDATFLSLRRLGWSLDSFRLGHDDLGDPIDAMRFGQAEIARRATQSANRWSDRQSLYRPPDGRLPGYWCLPIFWDSLRPLFDAPDKVWPRRLQASLRSLVSGTQWSQRRMFLAKRARHDVCTRCQGHVGTIWNRHYDCAATAWYRHCHASDELQRAAATARELGEAAGELFARGIFPTLRPIFPRLPIDPEKRVMWINRPASGYLTGTIFSDGSALFPRHPILRRAGWSLVQVDNFGNLVAAAYGPVPYEDGPGQQARDGEDYAYAVAPQLVLPPARFYVDCAGTLRCLQGGLSYCEQHSSQRVHIWRAFWAAFDAEDFTAHKTKAHCTVQQTHAGLTTWWERTANGHADRLCRQGALVSARSPEDVWLYAACHRIATMAAKYGAALEATLGDDKQWDHEELEGAPVLDLKVLDEPEGGIWEASGCPLPPVPAPAVPGVVPIPIRLNGHCILERPIETPGKGSIIYCRSCGAYSWKKLSQVGFGSRCLGRNAVNLRPARDQLERDLFPGPPGRDWPLGPPHSPSEGRVRGLDRKFGLPGVPPAPVAPAAADPPRPLDLPPGPENGPGPAASAPGLYETPLGRSRTLQHFGIGADEWLGWACWARDLALEARRSPAKVEEDWEGYLDLAEPGFPPLQEPPADPG